MNCNLCPRKCGVDREYSLGYCNSSDLVRIARVALHSWEEPIISGIRGSGTIFFSGCNLRCVYCQNFNVSHNCQGVNYDVPDLIDAFKRLEGEGAHNINLVTANHYLDIIRVALDKYKPSVPICYNTSGYDNIDTLTRMNDYIDIYLTDLKYMDDALANSLSAAHDYPAIATEAIKFMRNKQDILENGLLRQGMIVRHLVLPGYLDNTKKVLEWLNGNLPKQTIISLMNQFTPICGLNPPLDRRLKPLEYKIALAYAENTHFTNIYIQEGGSADTCYIPSWDGEIIKL